MNEPKKRHLERLDEQADEVIPFKPTHKVVCPFCKLLFYMGKEPDGTSAITHKTPACKEFMDMDVEDFLRKVRMVYSP